MSVVCLTDSGLASKEAFCSDSVQLLLCPLSGIRRVVLVADNGLPELDLLGKREVFNLIAHLFASSLAGVVCFDAPIVQTSSAVSNAILSFFGKTFLPRNLRQTKTK